MDIAKKYSFDMEGTVQMQDRPLGQQIRGAFGELMTKLDAQAKEQFADDTPTAFYFRDSFPVHTVDNEPAYPIFNKNQKYIDYICKKCKLRVSYKTDTGIRTRIDRDTKHASSFSTVFLSGTFRTEIVANLKFKQYIPDLEYVLSFIKDNGLRLGKQHDKGSKFNIKNVKEQIISDSDIKARAVQLKNYKKYFIHFLSSAIIKSEPTQSLITTLHFFNNVGQMEGKILISPRTDWKIYMLHYKESTQNIYKTEEYGSPPGYITEASLMSPNDVFYEALAMAEQLYGIGEWIAFGKGNFEVREYL